MAATGSGGGGGGVPPFSIRYARTLTAKPFLHPPPHCAAPTDAAAFSWFCFLCDRTQRGYAARARAGAADEGGRCWPLGGESGPLPPIEVRRFRWWADEAALAKELAEEDGEEERRKAAMRRKRSVVELFAAVPRVAAEGGDGRRVRRKLDKGKLVAGVLAKKGFKKDKAPSTEIAATKKVRYFLVHECIRCICITWIWNVFALLADLVECVRV